MCNKPGHEFRSQSSGRRTKASLTLFVIAAAIVLLDIIGPIFLSACSTCLALRAVHTYPFGGWVRLGDDGMARCTQDFCAPEPNDRRSYMFESGPAAYWDSGHNTLSLDVRVERAELTGPVS